MAQCSGISSYDCQVIERFSLLGRGSDAMGECAQDEDRGELVGSARARAAEAAAAFEQLAERQPPQLVAELVWCRDNHAAQLDESDASSVDSAPPSEQQQPQRLLVLPGSWRCALLGCEREAGGAHRVELVILAAQPPLGAACAFDLVYLLAVALQQAHEARAIGPVPSTAHARAPGACRSANRSASA